jgi:hypothetical protein
VRCCFFVAPKTLFVFEWEIVLHVLFCAVRSVCAGMLGINLAFIGKLQFILILCICSVLIG